MATADYLQALLAWGRHDRVSGTRGLIRHTEALSYCRDHDSLTFNGLFQLEGDSSCLCRSHPVVDAVLRQAGAQNTGSLREHWVNTSEQIAKLSDDQKALTLAHQERLLWLGYVSAVYPEIVAWRHTPTDNPRFLQLVEDINTRGTRMAGNANPDTMFCENHRKIGVLVPIRSRGKYHGCGLCELPRAPPQVQPLMGHDDPRQHTLQTHLMGNGVARSVPVEWSEQKYPEEAQAMSIGYGGKRSYA